MTNCIHCHRCRDGCSFLSKYGLDIGDTDRLRELAFHCFLCGNCTRDCPVGIDGRQIILDMRRERASSGEKSEIEKQHKLLIAEKKDYKYRNWKHATAKSCAGTGAAFFPGCNFPSMYPKTNAALSSIFADAGIPTIYECCGKPIGELGLAEDEERIISGIRSRLEERGIREIITACPNCKAFYGDRLGAEVRSVYSKLSDLGIGEPVKGDISLFIPCPDREEHIWVRDLEPFVTGSISVVEDPQCCGLGGSAISLEKDIADGFIETLKSAGNERLYTYCASCTGRFTRCGLGGIMHILPEITGTHEKPDTAKSYINRMLTRIR